MANKQSVPGMALGGGALRQGMKNVTATTNVHREMPVNNALDAFVGVTEAAASGADFYQKYKNAGQQYKADNILQTNREQLQSAGSEEEFDNILRNFEVSFPSEFSEDSWGRNFWNNNGSKLLDAHRKDAERIKAVKQFEFGKSSLTSSLMDNQNLLANSSGDKGRMLLDKGLEDIAATPFLNEGEKENYRSGFIRNGVLNLALNDPRAATSYMENNMPASENREVLNNRLNEIQRLSEKVARDAAEDDERLQKISDYGQQMQLWVEKERGNLSDAEFYVLTAEDDKDGLWAMREERTQAPLGMLYKTVRKMGQGEKLSADEARDAGNYLISAYRQNKIGLDEAADLQERIMQAATDKTEARRFFDNEAAGLADKILLPDIDAAAGDVPAETFMDKKAKLAFEINDIYNAKRDILTGVFEEQGGKLTPAYARRINQQALRETREEMGLAENSGEPVKFGVLKRMLGTYYTGGDESAVWQRFCDEAPYAEDKKALFRKIAAEEERKVLSYPQFDSYAEVEAAGLEKGDRFYLRGRLATKA